MKHYFPLTDSRVCIIAEIAQAHDGSLGILHSYIDALADTGVDAIKFQTHIADAESSPQEPFRVNFSYEDATRMEYWRRMEFKLEQWIEIKKHCDKVGLIFLSSPFSIAAVDLLERVEVKAYKVGSGETSNLLLLERLTATRKPLILSTGLSTQEEIRQSMEFLSKRDAVVSLMQCTSEYPTPPEKVGLNLVTSLMSEYDCPVGLSDHSGTIFPSLAATTLGATILEFHVTFDRRMFGPDATSSLEIGEVSQLSSGVRFLEKSLAHPQSKATCSGSFDRSIFQKSLAVSGDLKSGHALRISDLESKKPLGFGIPASEYQTVLGKLLARDIKKHSFLKAEDIDFTEPEIAGEKD
jgi:N,N'-diacetyllegionaminate synthase